MQNAVITRIKLLTILFACPTFLYSYSDVKIPELNRLPVQQRVIIIMIDGFGEEYYRKSEMPNLNLMEHAGIFKIVSSLMPSVTNLNNASICTGELPEKHGITGNSFYDTRTEKEEFMEDAALVMAPTIFERAGRLGIRSALFSSKKKTIGLLSKGTALAVSPETASQEWIDRIGKPPSIYSREVNYWLFEAALNTLKSDSSIRLFYIHTTDYPMHTWAPEENESKEHLNKLDEYIGQLMKAAPDAMILITADHTVHHKDYCIDLEKICLKKNIPIKIAISAERDKYVKHHRGFGGTSYVYAIEQKNLNPLKKVIAKIPGVKQVLTRETAARKFHLMPQRIGELVVLADEHTVFGNLEHETEKLPANYRTHGSEFEATVPLFVYQGTNAPAGDFYNYNYKIASWLYR